MDIQERFKKFVEESDTAKEMEEWDKWFAMQSPAFQEEFDKQMKLAVERFIKGNYEHKKKDMDVYKTVPMSIEELREHYENIN